MSDIRGKRPKVLGERVAGLRLTPEERFVMARIDGQMSVAELVGLTGLEPARLEQIVSKLAFDGAVELDEPRLPSSADLGQLNDGGTTSLSDFAAALGMDPSSFGPSPAEVPAAPRRPRPVVRRRAPAPAPPEPSPPEPTLDEPAPEELAQAPEEAPATPPAAAFFDDLGLPELEEVIDEPDAPGPSEDEAVKERDEEIARAVAERNYRQVFEARWHPLPADARAGAARTAHGADLLALCFDPEPMVIAAVLENSTVGLDHVRLIAFYHRTGTGLEIVARRQDWLRDLLVERRLLRNPMIGDIVLGRVMGPKRLFPTYKVAIDRDIPEITRVKARGYIKKKWQTATSEERSDLVLRTEARCLILMTGCTFDAKTTAILCGRPINSVMFVQSIAKFPAAPPSLLAHLYKQPFVRKNPPLKKMLLSHPNMPGDVKRSI